MATKYWVSYGTTFEDQFARMKNQENQDREVLKTEDQDEEVLKIVLFFGCMASTAMVSPILFESRRVWYLSVGMLPWYMC